MSAPRPAWVHWCFWGSLSCVTVLLLATIIGAILWWMHPSWLHDVILTKSPWFPPIYYSCERAGYIHDESADMPFARRLPDLNGQLSFLINRMQSEGPRERAHAMGFTFCLLLNHNAERLTPSLNPTVRENLLRQLMAGLRSSDPNEQLAASATLCLLKPLVLLDDMIAIWAIWPTKIQDIASYHFAYLDDPRVCDLLVRWFERAPNRSHVHALVHQSDLRASRALQGILDGPDHSLKTTIITELASKPSNDSELLLAVKRFFYAELPKDGPYIDVTLRCLAKTPNGITNLLDLRTDPATSAFHRRMDSLLRKKVPNMTAEQQHRWSELPAIPE